MSYPVPIYEWQRLDAFSGAAMHALLQAREAVFVVEQRCAYQEADALDCQCWHLTARCDNQIAAYLRVTDPGSRYVEPSIGRVLTSRAYRGQGLGQALMIEGIRQTRETHTGCAIRISAQTYLLAFYERLGFSAVGTAYLEDDIPHIEMLLGPATGGR